jgi:exodeoxyribonuclease VII large subunit
VLADPYRPLQRRAEEVCALRERVRRAVLAMLSTERGTLVHTTARLTALGPAATLARGYAIVQRAVADDGQPVVRSVREAPPGTQLRIRLADGAVPAVVADHQVSGG